MSFDASLLQRLAAVIESRKGGDPEKSYVARLFFKGEDAILKKIAEEAGETVMAAKDAEHGAKPADEAARLLVGEVADLWFHSLVLLAQHNLTPDAVLAELARREGLSGIDEKAARKAAGREADDARQP